MVSTGDSILGNRGLDSYVRTRYPARMPENHIPLPAQHNLPEREKSPLITLNKITISRFAYDELCRFVESTHQPIDMLMDQALQRLSESYYPLPIQEDLFPSERDFFVERGHIWVKSSRLKTCLSSAFQNRGVFVERYMKMCRERARAILIWRPSDHGYYKVTKGTLIDLEDAILMLRRYPGYNTRRSETVREELSDFGRTINLLRLHDRSYERSTYHMQVHLLRQFLKSNPNIRDAIAQSGATERLTYQRPELINQEPQEVLDKRRDDEEFFAPKRGRPRGSKDKKQRKSSRSQHVFGSLIFDPVEK